MSWYTVGEIMVWLLIAAVLGFVIGFLVRGVIPRRGEVRRAPAPVAATPSAASADPLADSVADSAAAPVAAVPSRFAPQPEPVAAPRSAPMSTLGPEVALDPATARARAKVAAIARRTAPPGGAPVDDLVRIHGVGPKTAALLSSMGITSFAQLARFTANDIATVNEALEVFPGRIERDDWKGSARALQREVYGADPKKR